VNGGRIVVVPEQELQIGEWNGTGWVVIDPDTGAGAYYISGGRAGELAGGTFVDNIPWWVISLINVGLGFVPPPYGYIIGPVVGAIFLGLDLYNIWHYKTIGKLTEEEAAKLRKFAVFRFIWWNVVTFALLPLIALGPWGIAGAAVLVLMAFAFNYYYDKMFKEMVKKSVKMTLELVKQLKHRLSATIAVTQAKSEHFNVSTLSSFKASNFTDPINRGKNWLTNAQTPEGYWGYISGVKHTSFAIMALSEQEYNVSSATDGILKHQNTDGSFGDLQSTCFAVWALSKVEIENENGTNFILSAQEPDGSWGGYLNTSFAIIALNNSGISISDDTINWLLNVQNTDGGWGTPSQTFDTALALKALNLTGVSAQENETRKGMAWLEYHQNADGGWIHEDSSALALDVLSLNSSWNATSAIQWLLGRENPDNGWGIDRSQSYVTALVVSSLYKFDSNLAVNGTQWLLDNQNPDGGWGFSKEYSSGFLRDTALAGDVMSSDAAENWILAHQNPDGSWENVDHTSRAVIFLNDMEYDTTNATDWLIDAQNPDSGWGLTENYTSGTWETALAVKALSKKYYWTPEIVNGLNWLLYYQNPDDGWGINESDPYITSVVIDTFLSAGVSTAQPQLQDASNWLKNQSLNRTSDVAMRLLTLDEMGLLDSDTKEAGVQWLLDNQNEDGGWGSSKNHTSAPYNTALAIKALKACYGMSHTISLKSGWNLISAPLNLTTWELGDESVVGDPLNVTPKNSLTSIYRYNITSGSFEKCSHYDI
jgi:squalene cyclase